MSKNITKMSFSASPHLTHHPRGNSAINDAATIKIRCSRPLCSSQTTTHTPSTHLQRCSFTRRGDQKQQPHPHGQGACCSRTQQCANTSSQPPTPPIPTQPPKRFGVLEHCRRHHWHHSSMFHP